MKNVVYMAHTLDKYELPIAVADTVGELAQLCGTSKSTILSAITHEKHNEIRGRYKKIIIDEEGENL